MRRSLCCEIGAEIQTPGEVGFVREIHAGDFRERQRAGGDQLILIDARNLRFGRRARRR